MKHNEMQIFNLATAYKNSYVLLFGIANTNFDSGEMTRKGLALCNIPATTMAAFSGELYIKGMLQACAIRSEKEHNLFRLFIKLPTNIQDKIRNETSAKYIQIAHEELKFEEVLKDSAELFVKCRYCYEFGVSFNPIFIRCFLDALFETAQIIIK